MGDNYIDPTDPRLDGRSKEEREAGPTLEVAQQRVDPAVAKEAERVAKAEAKAAADAAAAAAAEEAAAAKAEAKAAAKSDKG